MSTLSVFKFAAAAAAQPMENRLLDLQQQQLIQVQDAAHILLQNGPNA